MRLRVKNTMQFDKEIAEAIADEKKNSLKGKYEGQSLDGRIKVKRVR